jgi:PAS domain S-box-containing protein
MKFFQTWEGWMTAVGGAIGSTWALIVLVPRIARAFRHFYDQLVELASFGDTLKRIEDGMGNIIATRRILMDVDKDTIHFETDARGKLLWANRLWHRITGLSRDEARGSGWELAVAEDGRHRFLSDYQQSIDHQRAFEGRVTYVDRVGNETTVALSFIPARNKAGEILSYHGVGEVL